MVPWVRTFRAPKQDEQLADCQDSIYPPPGSETNGAYAISDGTTTSFFSHYWAAILTQLFGESAEQAFSDWPTWLKRAQHLWRAKVQAYAQSKAANFWTKNDFYAGTPAAATFIGLTLGKESVDGIQWRALVLGDSCLFFLRADSHPISNPLSRSADFSYLVDAVQSYDVRDSKTPERYASKPFGTELPLVQGDVILLATDAFAKWLLLRQEQGQPIWGTILSLRTAGDFDSLVASARREDHNRLENDDVALGIITIGTAHKIYRDQIFIPSSANVIEPVRVVEQVAPELPTYSPPVARPPPAYSRPKRVSLPERFKIKKMRLRSCLYGGLAATFLAASLFLFAGFAIRGRQIKHLRTHLEAVKRQIEQDKIRAADFERIAFESRTEKDKNTDAQNELRDLRQKLSTSETERKALQQENRDLLKRSAANPQSDGSQKQQPTATPSGSPGAPPEVSPKSDVNTEKSPSDSPSHRKDKRHKKDGADASRPEARAQASLNKTTVN